ncbi:MAG: ABC transporter ATP-binding protein [Ignavibacteriales bacterium]
MPLVEARDLAKYFEVRQSVIGRLLGAKQQTLRAVDGVSFAISEGETVGLVGESGCGKSTVTRCVVGLAQPTGGSVTFLGKDVVSMRGEDLRAFRRSVQIVFQNPYASLNPRKTVSQVLGQAVRQTGVADPSEIDAEIARLLDSVGLRRNHSEMYPHQFSGGQRQRIAIARALAVKPRFLVCDEPVSALDVSVQAQILNLLMDLQAEYNLTYLIVAHDLGVIYQVCARVMIMYLGKVVESGPVQAVYDEPLHPYTRALLASIPVLGPGGREMRAALAGVPPSPADLPPGCRFNTRCSCAEPRCATAEPTLTEVSSGHEVACFLHG